MGENISTIPNNGGTEEPGIKCMAFNIGLVMLCLSFQTVTYGGISLFLPVILKDLNLNFTQGGALSASITIIYALMQIPSGYLGDRYGLKKIFFTGVIGTCVLCLAFGLITSYWQALLNQALSGFFRAFMFSTGLALLAGWFGPQKRATAMGFSLIGLFFGALVMNVLGPWLVSLYNWRFPFIAFSSVGIVTSLVFLFFGGERHQATPKQQIHMADVLQLFRYRFMWVCGVIQYVRLGIMNGIAFWLPSLLIEEKGFSLEFTGLIIAIRTFMIAPSNILGGYLSDRMRKPVVIIGVSLLVIAITTTAMVRVGNVAMLITMILINGAFIQLYFGPLFAAPVEKYGGHMTGTLTGFGNFFANLGSFTFAYLLGWLKDRTGFFETGFYFMSFTCIIGIIFAYILGRMRQESDKT
ncbi:MAG: MFS transporter [Deltaproteobacteria bacterium]|nr:MFS transporter [Deltaproteobacteria bacterium]